MKDTAIDREIQDLLAIDPAPEFTARVRARIAEEPPHGRWLAWPRLAVVAGGIAVVAIAVVLTLPTSDEAPVTFAHAPAAAPPSASPIAGRDDHQTSTAQTVTSRSETHARRVAVRKDEAEVIMPQEEIRGMRRLLAMASRNDAVLAAMFAYPVSTADSPIPEPSPLVIEPLRIEPLAPDSF